MGKGNSNMIVTMIEKVYTFLWGDLIKIPLPGGSTLGISLLILLLIPTGIYFTIRTKLLPIRLFPDMVRALSEKKSDKNNLSAFQTLIVSTATRVGMGNLVGVVAAISAGGAERYSGCGHGADGPPLLLSKQPWHSSIKKRILFMVATGAVLPTISIATGKKNRAENEKRFCFPFCLPFPA